MKSTHVLFITPVPTHPVLAGNNARIKSLIEKVIELGYDVTVAHVGIESGGVEEMRKAWGDRYHFIPYRNRRQSPLEAKLRRIGERLKLEAAYTRSIDSWYSAGIEPAIRRLAEQKPVDAVFVEYVFLSKVLNLFDQRTTRVIDTHDVFAGRHKRYLEQGQRPKWFSTTRRQEARGLRRADVILAIQSEEADYFRSIVDKDVRTVGHPVQVFRPERYTLDRGHPKLLFVASGNSINLRAYDFLVHEILPRVRGRHGPVVLNVAGSICEHIRNAEGVLALGRMDDLRTAYAASDIVINPVTFGTGLNIKAIEAMGHGKALVTTKTGAKGIDSRAGCEHALEQGATAEELAQSIIDLIDDPEAYRRAVEGAQKCVKNWNKEIENELVSILSPRIRRH